MEVLCYCCDRRVILNGGAGQRCPQCAVVLDPAPAWATAYGWPQKRVPACERRRLKGHATVPVKRIRFHGTENRLLAHRLELLAHSKGIRMGEFLLQLLRRGLDAEDLEAEP